MNNFAGVKINNFSPKILIINICLPISLNICFVCSKELSFIKKNIRDQARGRLGRNSRPRGRNLALNGTQGEVGVSLKKKKKFISFSFCHHTNASCGDIIGQSTTTASCFSFH